MRLSHLTSLLLLAFAQIQADCFGQSPYLPEGHPMPAAAQRYPVAGPGYVPAAAGESGYAATGLTAPLPYSAYGPAPTPARMASNQGPSDPSLVDPNLSVEQRLALLEEAYRKQLKAAEKADQAKSEKPSFQLGGQLQVDYLWVGQDAENRAQVGNAQDAIDFRRARLVGRGEAFDILEYMIGFDFALADRVSFLDVWVGVRDLPILGHARVGHFFEPFSLERITQNQRNTFMERSLLDTFAPARNTGIEAYDSLGEEDRATYAVGWFATSADQFGQQFTDTGGQAITARTTWLPYWDEASDGGSFVHVGAAYSFRTPPKGRFNYETYPEARLRPPPGSSPVIKPDPFVSTGAIDANYSHQAGCEFAWVAGPLYIQSEYCAVSVDQIGGSQLFFDAAYVNVSYFLTGENRTYNKLFGMIDRVYPHENFFRVRTVDGSIGRGKGAWEIAGRYSFIDLNDANIQGGTLHDFTIGLNWYLNAFTRVKWELIQANLNRAPVGESQAYIAGMRFDIDF